MREMFNRIDRHGTNNMDIETLRDYFSGHLGEYTGVLTALETLNIAILSAMDKTKMGYENSSRTDQFVTRFLLRETMNQLHSLHGSLECALETMGAQAGRDSQDVKKTEPQRVGRRCNRRSQKSVCLSPMDSYSGILTTGLPVEADTQWLTQINRLQQLIDHLEGTNPRLETFRKEMILKPTESHILVAQRQIAVTESCLEEFKQSLRQYSASTAAQCHCLHISAERLSPEPCYILYEFWQDTTSWRGHLQSNPSKTFQRAIIDWLESPEHITTMLLPASWWKSSDPDRRMQRGF
ncbi:N-terminal EF-hand calcium-binding protein 3 isoform X2 [Ascaphus truei]